MRRFDKIIVYLRLSEGWQRTAISLVILKFGTDIVYHGTGLALHGIPPNPDYCFTALSYLSLIPVAMLFRFNKDKPSSYALLFMLAGILIPQLSYTSLLSRNHSYTVVLYLCFAVMIVITNHEPARRGYFFPWASRLLDCIWLSYLALGILLIIKRGGFDFRALNFSTIYELRSENEAMGLWGYVHAMLERAVFVFFVVYYIQKKEWLRVALCILVQIGFYLSFGDKAALFTIVVVIIVLMLIKWGNLARAYPAVFGCGLMIAMVMSKASVSDFGSSLLIDRLSFIPVKIANNFFDFFRTHDKLWFGEGMIGRLYGYQSPYTEPLFIYISKLYTRIPGFANENTGAFSFAFADGGFMMMLVTAIIIGLILRYFDSVNPHNLRLSAVSLVSTALLLVDSPFLTALLTGGIFIQMVLMHIANGSEQGHIEYADNS